MKVAFFNTKPYDRAFFERFNIKAGSRQDITFFEPRLTLETASLADGSDAVCVFVNDVLDAGVLEKLHAGGTRYIALRCAGFNNVDLVSCASLGMKVVRVPAYSPHAVAEHTVGLVLTLNRRIHRAYARVREGNFSLDGLLGFDLHGRTTGIVGTGKIGSLVAGIFKGFGCRVLAYDNRVNPDCTDKGVEYVPFDDLLQESDIVSLHCPLTPDTHHLIRQKTIEKMKTGAMLVNTSRGGIIDTRAVIQALKSGKLGSLAIDVYEEEGDYFFEDLSDTVINDDILARLLTFHNVLVTGHQAFFTREAMEAIASTTLQNLTNLESRGSSPNEVTQKN